MKSHIRELTTPALVVDQPALMDNLSVMSTALPGDRLRPHVKAHKCTALGQLQVNAGHRSFTCATVREVEGMAAAGLGEDLLLANEVLDCSRLGALRAPGVRVTVAVDSPETIAAASQGGVQEVLIDVDVGLRRCGCAPADAGDLAAIARRAGLLVRGVMGYEGHAMFVLDRAQRSALVDAAMRELMKAQRHVGGEIISAGGTGSYDLNGFATELQAGSYALMDTAYAKLGLPFRQALYVLATVISVHKDYAVANCGLKALGMDKGLPDVDEGEVLSCSDEHLTFRRSGSVRIGDTVRVWPAHVDPTVAYHDTMWVADGDAVKAAWPIDLRGW